MRRRKHSACSVPTFNTQRLQNNHTHTHTHTHARARARARLTALCPGLPWSAGTRKVKPIWILLKQEIVSGSGISWAIYKSALRSRQITTSAPHHSVFYRPDAFLPPNQQRQSTERQYLAIQPDTRYLTELIQLRFQATIDTK